MKTPRFPIGLEFQRKRFPKAKELTNYRIDDIQGERVWIHKENGNTTGAIILSQCP